MLVVAFAGYGLVHGGGPGKARASVLAASIASAAAVTWPRGIDVSSYQESYGISWPKVYAGGYRFAIIKSSEGNYYRNPYYGRDIKAATAAGLYVSAYHFANPSASGGAAQARYAYTEAGNYKVGDKHLPFVLDIEYDPYSTNKCYGLSHAQTVAWISAFLSEAKTLTGATPIINTYSDWWDVCTGSSTAFAGYPMWINSYHVGGPASLPAGWKTWLLWQYGQSAKVSGITGTVDLDYFGSSPASETTTTGHAVSIQLHTLPSMAGWVVRYTATGLPPGVTMTSSGLISGTFTTAGSYTVTVNTAARTSVVPATISFTWTVATA
jgi:GH25 family lysozyme M1 (1,4-beta-N-acetylmuramidase)